MSSISEPSAAQSNVTHALVQHFFDLYPSEAARLLNDLSFQEILTHLQAVPIITAARLFTCLNPDVAIELIKIMEDEFFVQLFKIIDIDRTANILTRLEHDLIDSRLRLLPTVITRESRELMTYPPGSAGRLMDPRVLRFNEDDKIEEVLNRIRLIQDRRVTDICVVDNEGRLIGVIPLQDIVTTQLDKKVGQLVDHAL